MVPHPLQRLVFQERMLSPGYPGAEAREFPPLGRTQACIIVPLVSLSL
jgi:hypothetical protein